MAKKKRKRKGLDTMAEEFAASLIWEVTSGKLGRGRAPDVGEEDKENPVSFRDRRALLDSITKLLGTQKEPEDGDEAGINSFREHLRGGSSGTDSDGADTDAADAEA